MVLKNTSFYESVIKRCDFNNTDLSKADFRKTDLNSSVFHHSDLSGADFIDAVNYSINPFNNKVSKAKFSKPDVYEFLNFLDIIIK